MGLNDIYEEIENGSEEVKAKYASLLCGNELFEGSVPYAHNYCGH
jgi:uncharacterized protein YdiU (UPF0061 family)